MDEMEHRLLAWQGAQDVVFAFLISSSTSRQMIIRSAVEVKQRKKA